MKLGEISTGCSLACSDLWILRWARTRQPMGQVHRRANSILADWGGTHLVVAQATGAVAGHWLPLPG